MEQGSALRFWATAAAETAAQPRGKQNSQLGFISNWEIPEVENLGNQQYLLIESSVFRRPESRERQLSPWAGFQISGLGL